jgi:hypothetical protein
MIFGCDLVVERIVEVGQGLMLTIAIPSHQTESFDRLKSASKAGGLVVAASKSRGPVRPLSPRYRLRRNFATCGTWRSNRSGTGKPVN